MARSLLKLAMAVTGLVFTNAFPTAAEQEYNTKRDNPIGGPLALPFPVSDFTQTVSSLHNTYCGPEYNKPGQKVGDQTILYSIGDGDDEPRVTIYHSDSLGLIAAYMGTNLSSIISTLADVDSVGVPSDPILDLPDSVLVFQGFQNSWRSSWDDVKDRLHKARQIYPNDTLTITGHSQGGADAILGAISIRNEFGAEFINKIITYGPPRTGNNVFADIFDSYFKGRYTGVTNGADWVSDVPPPYIGYRHPSGMVWINPANSTSWGFYPDQEDLNGIDSRIPQYIDPETHGLYWYDHRGVYMHSMMHDSECPTIVGGY